MDGFITAVRAGMHQCISRRHVTAHPPAALYNQSAWSVVQSVCLACSSISPPGVRINQSVCTHRPSSDLVIHTHRSWSGIVTRTLHEKGTSTTHSTRCWLTCTNSLRYHRPAGAGLQITRSLAQLKFWRFSPRTLHLEKKIEVLLVEGGEVLQGQPTYPSSRKEN